MEKTLILEGQNFGQPSFLIYRRTKFWQIKNFILYTVYYIIHVLTSQNISFPSSVIAARCDLPSDREVTDFSAGCGKIIGTEREPPHKYTSGFELDWTSS